MFTIRAHSILSFVLLLGACSNTSRPDPVGGPVGTSDCAAVASLGPAFSAVPLDKRAYVVSRDSDKVTVLDTTTLEAVGSLTTCTGGAHMAETSTDFSTIYVSSPDKNVVVVVDARTMRVKSQIPVGSRPGHMSMAKNGKLLAVMAEADNAVSFIDPAQDIEVKRLPGFSTPHFARFTDDGQWAYVANITGYHITRVRLDTLTIDGHIPLEGFGIPPEAAPVADDGGFADVQIDEGGMLYAAHGETGRVLVYDTNLRSKVRELTVGPKPWVVYAQHPFRNILNHVVPSFADQSVALIAKASLEVRPLVGAGDRQSYGVNYSPLAPNKAFVMNRIRRDVAIVDTTTGKATGTIAVGGTTETASTTPDGKYIFATVSSSNSVAVIDVASSAVVKTIADVGTYPWSVTIPNGQNYCH